MAEPISVTAGFGWTAAGAWATAAAVFGGIVTLIIKSLGPWRKQTTEAETRLREGLEQRVNKLERMLERQQAVHNAERSADRHKINNLTQCFDTVMLMLEAAPERTAEVVAKVRSMREAQMLAEAEEKAHIHSAILTSTRDETHDT